MIIHLNSSILDNCFTHLKSCAGGLGQPYLQGARSMKVFLSQFTLKIIFITMIIVDINLVHYSLLDVFLQVTYIYMTYRPMLYIARLLSYAVKCSVWLKQFITDCSVHSCFYLFGGCSAYTEM